MNIDVAKLARAEAAMTAARERADMLSVEHMDSPLLAYRTDEFNESLHPRGPDGKFIEGAGAAGASAKEYLSQQAKAGKKATPNGMMQHLLMNGGISKAEIWATTQANFEMKPGLNNYVSAVLAQMKTKGIDVPEPPDSKSKGPKPKVEPEVAAAMEPPKKDEPPPESAFVPGGAAVEGTGNVAPGLPEPNMNSQTQVEIANIASDLELTLNEKIEAIDALSKVDGMDFVYGQTVVVALIKQEDEDYAASMKAEAEPAALPTQKEPKKATAADLAAIITGPGTPKEKLALLQQFDDAVDPDVEQQFMQLEDMLLTQTKNAEENEAKAAKQEVPPAPAAPEGLPKPMNTQQDDIFWMANTKSYSLEEKAKYISEMKVAPKDEAYKAQALAMVGGSPEAPSAAAVKEAEGWGALIDKAPDANDLKILQEDIEYTATTGKITTAQAQALKDKITAKNATLKAPAPLPPPMPPMPTSKIESAQKKMLAIKQAVVSPVYSHEKKLQFLKSWSTGSKNAKVKQYAQSMLAWQQAHGAQAQPPAPAAGPASTSAPTAAPVAKALPEATAALAATAGLSSAAKAKLLEMNNHWDKVLPENKAPIEQALVAIETAAQEGPEAYLKALKAQPDLSGGGLAKSAFNESLAALKAAAGITTPAPATGVPKGSAYTPKTPAQTQIYDTFKAEPKQKYTEISELENATGQTVESKLVRNLKEIPGEYHALVASAVGGPPPNGMAPEVDQAMASYQDYVRDKTPLAQLQAMQSYKGTGYTAMNNALLKGNPTGSVKASIDKVREAIKSNVCPADLPVFRGLRCSLKDLSGFDDPAQAVGRCFEHKNFASVSRSPKTAENFGDDTMMEFTLKAGTPAYPLPWPGEKSSKYGGGGERELVLSDRSMFRIDKVIEEQHPGKAPGTKRHRIFVTYLGVPV